MLLSQLHGKPAKQTVFCLDLLGVFLTIPSTSGSEVQLATPSPYMTRKQVAAYLNVSEKWLAQSGRAIGPRFYKFGGHCRYLFSDVTSWARQQRVCT